MSVVVVATVEHHRIVGLPRQSQSVVLGNIRVTLFFNCWSVIANIREALSKKKLSLCFFVCSILCSTACLPRQSCQVVRNRREALLIKRSHFPRQFAPLGFFVASAERVWKLGSVPLCWFAVWWPLFCVERKQDEKWRRYHTQIPPDTTRPGLTGNSANISALCKLAIISKGNHLQKSQLA